MNGTCKRNKLDWVELVGTDVCDGIHPQTGMPCVIGRHNGYHRTADGAEWLDD